MNTNLNGGAGKGDMYRKVDKKKFDDNYDRIFGKKPKTSQEKYAENYEEIFRKNGEPEKVEEKQMERPQNKFALNYDSIFRKPVPVSLKTKTNVISPRMFGLRKHNNRHNLYFSSLRLN